MILSVGAGEIVDDRSVFSGHAGLGVLIHQPRNILRGGVGRQIDLGKRGGIGGRIKLDLHCGLARQLDLVLLVFDEPHGLLEQGRRILGGRCVVVGVAQHGALVAVDNFVPCRGKRAVGGDSLGVVHLPTSGLHGDEDRFVAAVLDLPDTIHALTVDDDLLRAKGILPVFVILAVQFLQHIVDGGIFAAKARHGAG